MSTDILHLIIHRIILLFFFMRLTASINQNAFPKDFLFGCSTSAYQIEGAWNISGKGRSDWDVFTHQFPELIKDGSNADVACDSYHRYQDDVELLKSVNAQLYRFSISWPRIFPKGLSYIVNEEGISYYNALIDRLLENNIQPMVTLFHGDVPHNLVLLGGFHNPLFVDWFEMYARIVFERFGDRVKLWISINDVYATCVGFGAPDNAPVINETEGISEYLCIKNLLLAHARVYHMYNQEFRQTNKGKFGLVYNADWYERATESESDTEAAQIARDFKYGLILDPILSNDGDFPESVKLAIAKRSELEGFKSSRLPTLTSQEIDYIRGTLDFLGLNHYTAYLIKDQPNYPVDYPSIDKDMRVNFFQDPSWPSTSIDEFKIVPWGLRSTLRYIKEKYGDIEMFITENGLSDSGQINDKERVNFHQEYLSVLLDAIHEDKINVKGYCVWSLLDNFEWSLGYTVKFGLYYVDFKDPNRKRIPKLSSKYYAQVIKKKVLPVFNID